jgi:hypothetical protein
MSEGNVYICQWEQSGELFRVWVGERPSLTASAESLREALEELSGVVCRKTGDGEAVFELDPPAGGNAAADHYVALAGNSGWYPPTGFSLDVFGTLYEAGVCKTCCRGIGPRSQVPIPVGTVGDADLLIGGLRMPSEILASESFRSRLVPAERSHVEWVPVDLRGKSRRQFFELRARQVIKAVEDKATPISGWRCPDCKSVCFSADYEHLYVAKPDLTKFKADLVMIDSSHCVKPAIPYSRWTQIRGKSGTRNLTSTEVVPVPRARLRRRPVLKMLTKAHSRSIRREFDSLSSWERSLTSGEANI